MCSAQHRPIAHCLGRPAFHEAFIRDIGIGPLIDANEFGTAGHGNGKSRNGRIGKHIDPERDADGPGNAIRDNGHEPGCFGPDIVRLAKGDIAMVFDDQAMQSPFHAGFRVAHAGIVNRIHIRPPVAGCPGEGRAMDHSNEHLVGAEYLLHRVGATIRYFLHVVPFHRFFEIAACARRENQRVSQARMFFQSLP